MGEIGKQSYFSHVELAPPDPIFNLQAKYVSDEHPLKVNAGVGAYRTEDGNPYVLPIVAKVESAMATDKTLNHEYLPIHGLQQFSVLSAKLALGSESEAILQNRVASVQAISGTGALRLAGDFITRFVEAPVILISKPTWGNHGNVFRTSGIKDIREYRYYLAETRSLDLNGMLEDLRNAPESAIVLLHSCAHNPTGVDPSQDDWKQIADVCKERKLLPLFDLAYQGFASGDPNLDAWALRYFVSRGFELFVAQSFAKIFGLYNERAGNLHFVCSSDAMPLTIESQLKRIIRPMYSNPPNHGARIVATILNNPALYGEWLDQLKSMSNRIQKMRELLFNKLKTLGTPGDWSHILNQKGMFTFTGLNPQQVEILEHKYHFYMLKSGRINMCGLTESNMDRVAGAFHDVVTNNSQ